MKRPKIKSKQATNRDIKKDAMCKYLQDTFGNVSLSCERAGITRQTHYNWIESDKVYADHVLYCSTTRMVEYGVNKLMGNVAKGDQRAVEYLLDCKGRADGWGKVQQFEDVGKAPEKIEIIVVRPPSAN
jgi:hypothetical protein